MGCKPHNSWQLNHPQLKTFSARELGRRTRARPVIEHSQKPTQFRTPPLQDKDLTLPFRAPPPAGTRSSVEDVRLKVFRLQGILRLLNGAANMLQDIIGT